MLLFWNCVSNEVIFIHLFIFFLVKKTIVFAELWSFFVEGEIFFRTTSTRVLCIVLIMKGNKYAFLLRCLYNVHWIYNFFTVLMRKYYLRDEHRFIQSISIWFKGSLDYLISHQGGKLLKCNVNSKGGYLKGTSFR